MKISNRLLKNFGLLLVCNLALGCSSDDACEGAACNAATGGSGASGGSGGTAGSAGSGGAATCTPWADPNACETDMSCPATAEASLQAVTSVRTRADANPEIVEVIPGTDDRAVVVSSVANQVSELIFGETSLEFGREVVIDTGSDTSNMTSIKVDPTGSFAAVTVTEEDCLPGQVLLIDLGTDFGTVLGSVPVGYGPDSSAFSKDGKYLVTANEDDREDHPCKPVDRMGGSITIIDLSGGPASATVVQTIMVDQSLDSEPEGIAISASGAVIVPVQETSELVRFSLADVPNATAEIVAMSAGCEPDAAAITDDGSMAVVGCEGGDSLTVIEMASGAIISEHVIRNSGDVPDSYNRDDGDTDHVHEPEGVVLFRESGQLFAGVALQESHAVLLYRLSDVGELSFDSIAQSGIDWAAEEGGRVKSAIGPEGLTVHRASGMLLSANEREGSVTLFRTSQTLAQVCSEP